jgi:excisionase family DNA binding protein
MTRTAPKPTGLPALLSKKQVAEATGLSERTIDRRIEDGTFKAHRIGPRIIRIERDSILGVAV